MSMYGIFYKDWGVWRGPWHGFLYKSPKSAEKDLRINKNYIKKKAQVRKLVGEKI